MTNPFIGEPSEAEKADAAAYIRHRDCPSPQTETLARKAWFALTGGFPITTPGRCTYCGLHMTGRTKYEACRLCGQKEIRKNGK